jgi:hypothetical protein
VGHTFTRYCMSVDEVACAREGYEGVKFQRLFRPLVYLLLNTFSK